MLGSIFKILFPNTFANKQLAQFNTRMLDYVFGENAKHKRIAGSYNYDRAIRYIVKNHNNKSAQANPPALKVKNATNKERIFLSMVMVSRYYTTSKDYFERNKGIRYLEHLHQMLREHLEASSDNNTPLLPHIVEFLKVTISDIEA